MWHTIRADVYGIKYFVAGEIKSNRNGGKH
jgi:hypothetical protein